MESINNAAAPFDPRFLGVASVAGRRPVNEDAFAAPPPGAADAVACFVVADGVGGQERGDVASRTAVAAGIRAFYERRAAGDAPAAALLAAVSAANAEVYRLAQSLGVERMGCTLAAAALGGGRLDVVHVGDARAWLWQGGRLYALTRDHTWVQEQVDRGTITPADAAQHELRHIVTRVLGNEATVEATLARPAAFGPGDRLLLSSDGLHDVVDETRLAQLLGTGAPGVAAQTLVEAALAGGSEDNVTALVVEGRPASAARPHEATPVAQPREVAPAARHATEVLPPDNKRIAGVPPATQSPSEVTTVQGKRPPPGYIPPRGRAAPSAPPARPRRRAALLPALGVAALVLLFFVWLGMTLSRGNGGANGPDGLPTAAVPAGSGATAMPSAAATLSAATSTSAPTGYPDPTTTAEAGATVVVGGVMCIEPPEGTYRYSNEKAAETELCHFADDLLQGPVIIMEGRQLITAEPDCKEYEFQQVQSATFPDIVGWVLATRLVACPEER